MPTYALDTSVDRNAPRILWRSTVLEEQAGDTYETFIDNMTWNFAEIAAVSTLTLANPIACNAIGIEGAEWAGQTVIVEYDDGAGWTQAGAWNPITGVPFLGVFDFQTADNWRLSIIGSPLIASVIKFGMALAMERNIYKSFAPITKQIKALPKMQLGAHFTGVQELYARRSASYSFKNLHANWYRAYFKEMQFQAMKKGMFILWRSGDYKKECVYGFIDNDIKPSNQGQRDYMQVNFSIEGPLQ